MKIVACFFLLFSIVVIAGDHGHEDEKESSSVGPDKGILEFHEDEGFKLSPEAIKSFSLAFAVVGVNHQIPVNSLLESQGGKFVYREQEGFLKRVPVEVVKKLGEVLTIRPYKLSPGDRIVATGVGFVRGAELDAMGGISHGH